MWVLWGEIEKLCLKVIFIVQSKKHNIGNFDSQNKNTNIEKLNLFDSLLKINREELNKLFEEHF